jgi:hypothetical protein
VWVTSTPPNYCSTKEPPVLLSPRARPRLPTDYKSAIEAQNPRLLPYLNERSRQDLQEIRAISSLFLRSPGCRRHLAKEVQSVTSCVIKAYDRWSHQAGPGLLDGGEGDDRLDELVDRVGSCQVDREDVSMVVIGGKDDEVIACAAPSVGLRLMAEHEDIRVQ